jgi:hypothetical protein
MSLSVKLLATGWTTDRSEFESWYSQEFSLLYVVQPGSGVHPTSYTVGTGCSFPRVKLPGREADYSLPSSAEVKKNVDLYTYSTIRLHGVVLN